MQLIIWLIMLVLAATGAAAIVDYFGIYDVPMIDVVKQVEEAVEAVFK